MFEASNRHLATPFGFTGDRRDATLMVYGPAQEHAHTLASNSQYVMQQTYLH
jgi:hypothetical protein